jgi:peptidyl-prolyl cis-trans isomerase C
MKRYALIALCLLAAGAALAQQPAPPVDDSQMPVASINGEIITKAKLDFLYANLSVQMRQQYEQAGGKVAFLDNYVAKRLLIQEAMKTGFDKKPETLAALDVARESALFDRYVRDVVAATVVTEADVRKHYDENQKDFAVAEMVKVRHIVAGVGQGKEPEQALQKIQRVLTEIRAGIPAARAQTPEMERILLSRFSEAARKYSEDGSAPSGGDLGWRPRGVFDKQFEEAAFNMPRGVISGIVETQFGYHLILVEDKKSGGTQPFESVRADVREFLLSQRGAQVIVNLKQLTNELRASSKVALYPENVD